jgi:hypothetical protein
MHGAKVKSPVMCLITSGFLNYTSNILTLNMYCVQGEFLSSHTMKACMESRIVVPLIPLFANWHSPATLIEGFSVLFPQL